MGLGQRRKAFHVIFAEAMPEWQPNHKKNLPILLLKL